MTYKDSQPSLKPTSPSSLAVAAVLGLSVTFVAVGRWYQHVPTVQWYNAVAIVVIAIAVAFLAWRTQRQLKQDRDRLEEPVDVLQIARFAPLAKATAIAGAAIAGAYGGFSLWLWLQSGRPTTGIEHDSPNAIAGLIASILLVVAALWLEKACRVPPEDTEERAPDDGE